MSNDKVIRFPGVRSTKVGAPEGGKPGRVDDETPIKGVPVLPEKVQLNADQTKAVQMIVSGMTFICIGIKPTDSGADFFTSLNGDADELRNAEQHLPDVIARLYQRKGIR